MPDATPTSIAPPSPPARRNKVWVVAQFAVAAIVFISIGRALAGQWRDYQHTALVVHPDWRFIALSGIVVLATYALLIEVWRRILAEWKSTISFGDAARIWCVSNLGKYVPGKVWQILAMGQMAQSINVPPAAAAGSAIVSTVVNIGMGFAVAVVTGWSALDVISKGHAALGIVIAVATVGGVLLLPVMIPFAVRLASRITRRPLDLGTLPRRAVYIAIVGNIAAWILYGWSFQLLVHGVLGNTRGSLGDYIAAYALSYVIGYLVLVVPGGIGTRELVQTTALTAMGLADVKQAAVIAVTSRLWLTVLELLPGFIYLARGARRRPQATTARDRSKP
ncbi:MAG: lysylphosphatidylglycerol synthase domain-containing protein [bacterium]